MDIRTIINRRETFSAGIFRMEKDKSGWAMRDDTGSLPLTVGNVETENGMPYFPVNGQLVDAAVIIEFDKKGVKKLVARVKPSTVSSIMMLSSSELPQPEAVATLDRLIQSLTLAPLRNFCNALFSDKKFAQRYVTVAASWQQHHSQPGGLLIHSLEMAEQALTGEWPIKLSRTERELLAVASLVHDVGKTVTSSKSARILKGRHHEAVGFILLADALEELEAEWEVGAEALIAVLSDCSLSRNRHGNRMALMLSTLDRISAFGDAERQAFRGKPDRWKFATLGKDKYWRLPSLGGSWN